MQVINAKDVTLTVGDKFDALKDVTASDKEDKDLTKSIKVVLNKVDTTKAGAYLVTYEVSDSQGATATKTITVTVKDKVIEEDKKEETNKDKGTNTGLGLGTGLFAGLATTAVSGLGIFEVLKRRNRK